MDIDLRGRIAVVTGASGELGRTIARTLARCGAHIAVHYHSGRERAETLRGELAAQGVRAITVAADVGDPAAVNAMRDVVTAQLGDADIIVNNAVSQYAWTAVLDQPIADFTSQYRSCVVHNVAMAQAFVPAMVARRSGRVIAINTECAMQNNPTQGAYVAGKRGMDGVLRVLAKEVAEHQVTVNQVAPGWMISDKHRAAGSERQPAYEKNVPMRRRGTDQDVANVVAFLASDLANFITGVYLPVCGGQVMPAI